MNTRIAIAGTMLLGFSWLCGPARAQYGGAGYNYPGASSDSVNGPTVSPYLNLLQRNNFGLPNYQTLVQPFIEQRDATQRNSYDIQRLEQDRRQRPRQPLGRGQFQATGGDINPQLRSTGHPVRYQYHSHYYTPYRAR